MDWDSIFLRRAVCWALSFRPRAWGVSVERLIPAAHPPDLPFFLIARLLSPIAYQPAGGNACPQDYQKYQYPW
jgi:hypothetical protein